MNNHRLFATPDRPAGGGRLLRCAALALTLTAASGQSAAQIYTVHIDTTPLAGVAGFIAFDLVDGSSPDPSSVVISDFSSPIQLGSATISGGVTGSLPGQVGITSTSFFNSLLQGVQFAAGQTSFSLDFSVSHQALAIPASFALFLLDSSQAPFATSDPTGANALLVFDLTTVLVPQAYGSASAGATVTLIPEPGSWALFALGLAALAWVRQRA